jgi:hypothetical protein
VRTGNNLTISDPLAQIINFADLGVNNPSAESLRMLDNHFHSFTQHVDVGFDHSVILQEILDTLEMFAVVFRQEAHLEFFHRVYNISWRKRSFIKISLNRQST